MKKYGYIGKSFVLGSVGIVASLIAACGGGGITDVVAATSAPSSYVLFASGYKTLSSAAGDLKAQSLEGGFVYANSFGNFKWGQYSNGSWSDAEMQARGAFGLSFQQDGTTPDDTHGAYVAVKAPENGSVDISASGKMVIRTGNGTTLQYDSNAKKVFRIQVDGGEQNTTDWSFPYSCNYDLTLDPDAISDSGQPSSNPFGQATYEIQMSSFTCDRGSLTDLAKDLRQVTVKVLGGIDAATDNTSGAYTFIQAGMIAFTK